MFTRLLLGLAILFSLPLVSLADTFEFGVSNTSAHASYDAQLSQSFNLRTSFLHTDVKKAKVKHKHIGSDKFKTKTDRVTLGLFNGGNFGNTRLYIGGELYYLQTSVKKAPKGRDNSYGLSLGGGVHASIIPQFYITSNIMYSPDILNNGDHRSLTEFNLRFGYQMLSSTSLYTGYRYIGTTGKERDIQAFNGIVFGFNFSF